MMDGMMVCRKTPDVGIAKISLQHNNHPFGNLILES